MSQMRVTSLFIGILLILTGAIGILWVQQYRFAHKIMSLQAELHPIKAAKKSEEPQCPIATSGLWAAVQAKAKDTVVQVFAQLAETDLLQPYRTPSQGQAAGSGFFISAEGEIVTNAHVVSNATSVWVQMPSMGKHIIDVTVIGVCPDRDLALLRLTPESKKLMHEMGKKICFLPLGDSDKVHRSDELLALGYPLSQYSLKSTTGVVSGRENIALQTVIQISAPINPGSSGGPSLNRSGEVIGINTSTIMGAQNVNYIIPINELKIVVDDLRRFKLVRKPFFGVVPLIADAVLTEYLGNPVPGGLYVVEIYKKSLLENAGVRVGDMIYEINGYKVDNYGEMDVPWSEDRISITDYVARLKIGQSVTIVFYRKGTRKEAEFTFDLSELLPVHTVYPGYEPIDYEIIGGMVLMPLTLNHVALLQKVMPELNKYWETKEQLEPRLLLTHIFPDSQAHRSRAIGIGSIITEVNGKEVGTLADLRVELIRNKKHRFITFKTSQDLFIVLDQEKVLQDELRLSQLYRYPLSETVQALLEK